jgi:two-component system, sensor histidine kinase
VEDEMNILVVEDDPTVGSFLRILLELDRHMVISTRSSDVAMRVLESFLPDLVIADFELPGEFTGADICKAASRCSPDVKTIIISGLPMQDIRHSCQQAAPLAILQKPINYDRIAELIEGISPAEGSQRQLMQRM